MLLLLINAFSQVNDMTHHTYTANDFPYLPQNKQQAAADAFNQDLSVATHTTSNTCKGHGWGVPSVPDPEIAQETTKILLGHEPGE